MNKRLFDEVAKVAKKKEVHMEDVHDILCNP
jgi:hypothetical protein